MTARLARRFCLVSFAALLSGCNAVVMSPSGDIAWQQRNLIVIATVLMLLIVIPVMVLTGYFAWHYRHSNTKAVYKPDWDHSTQLELLIWSAPLLIVIMLGAVTWISTHTLDPYRKLGRIDEVRPIPADVKPLRVQVVALDWKWLFILPDYGVAAVNEIAAPIDVPIEFDITSSTVMNSFFVPALAGQIYAMPAMGTKLHAVINNAGDYEGYSANYSGFGFSHMHFRFKGMPPADFEQWIAKLREAPGELTRQEYQALEKPSQADPVKYYGKIVNGLYDAVLNLCVDPAKMCQNEMMAIDAKGGMGLAGIYNVGRLTYDADHRRGPGPSTFLGGDYVAALCALPPELLASPVTPASYAVAQAKP